MKGGLWARKFDKVNGETRVCRQCGDTFHTMKARWICKTCINANQRPIEEAKRARNPKKETYPFNNRTNEAGARFHRIQKELREAWKQYEETGDRTILIKHYDKQIKEIHENGIWEWIWDRRDDASKKENKLKTISLTRKEYPDTRGHYEE